MKTVTKYYYSDPTVSRRKVINKRNMVQAHYHSEYELYFLLSGKTKYFIKDTIYNVEKGDFVFIPKDTIHKNDSDDCFNNERLLLSIPEGYIDDDLKLIVKRFSDIKLINIPVNRLSVVEELFLKAEAEFKEKEKNHVAMIKSYVKQILILLDRYSIDQKPKLTETERLMFSISSYIKDNYNSELSLSKIGKEFGISDSHLCRIFKATCGMGISEYITYVRISNAEKLLSEKPEMTIIEVAAAYGFNNSAYFTSVFKKVKGITPYKFRKSVS